MWRCIARLLLCSRGRLVSTHRTRSARDGCSTRLPRDKDTNRHWMHEQIETTMATALPVVAPLRLFVRQGLLTKWTDAGLGRLVLELDRPDIRVPDNHLLVARVVQDDLQIAVPRRQQRVRPPGRMRRSHAHLPMGTSRQSRAPAHGDEQPARPGAQSHAQTHEHRTCGERLDALATSMDGVGDTTASSKDGGGLGGRGICAIEQGGH